VRGAIFDVAVDLRPESPALRAWHGVELSAENGRAFYIPAGRAHGFQTLTDGCEVLYGMGHRYVPEAARGVRWDDPAFAIEWPAVDCERVISEKDRSYPRLQP
jgi:dTDP-4-dehydrorhamnose 3,5-epimerase